MQRYFHTCCLHRTFQSAIAAGCFVAAVAATPAYADDFAGCTEGYNRYNQNIANFNRAADALERVPYCEAIAPEMGYAACQQFIQAGSGTDAQNDWAAKVSSNLVAIYKKCKAQ